MAAARRRRNSEFLSGLSLGNNQNADYVAPDVAALISTRTQQALAVADAGPEIPPGPPRATAGETKNRKKAQKAKQRARGIASDPKRQQ